MDHEMEIYIAGSVMKRDKSHMVGLVTKRDMSIFPTFQERLKTFSVMKRDKSID